MLLLTPLATGVFLAAGKSAAAREDQPGNDERPQKGGLLVLSEGDHAREVIKLGDLMLGGPPVHAWPKDPKTSVNRKGSRLNEIVVLKLDRGELDEETRSRCADGIVAHSVICTHAGCPVSQWVKAEGRDKNVLEFNPRESAQVVFGPAPLRVAALSMQIATVP
ncbi:2Fe-2S ferredoxin [Bradyrhizobium centrolobii]|uniref:2Fe-2S ferredoxin n=1 Tax=Bradyrhizobium centrolobii TaxID=1505087 RepID=UPI001FD9F3CE|nr:2Fe-2S ferredoxin [Bradyrhizobium centrolobii]